MSRVACTIGFLVLVAVACSADDSTVKPGTAECTDDVVCSCAIGPSGRQLCIDGKLGSCECPCDHPPPPGAPPPVADAGDSCFEPCGGDPTGGWVFASSCVPQGLMPNCGNGVVEATVNAAALDLQLLPGGAARGKLSTTVLLKLDRPPNCQQECSSSVWGDCQRDVCGECTCSLRVSAQLTFNPSSLAAKWELGTENSLLLNDANGHFVTYRYCVSGDTLKLNSDGHSVTYVLSRATCTGTAVTCRMRDATTCTQGFGCAPGHCGGSCSDFKTSAECQSHNFCLWQGSCGDLAGGLMCSNSLDNAGCQTRPGCRWQTDGCDGIGRGCSQLGVDECAKQPGCSWAAP